MYVEAERSQRCYVGQFSEPGNVKMFLHPLNISVFYNTVYLLSIVKPRCIRYLNILAYIRLKM